MDYTEVSTDKDINLESQSAIDVSGLTSQGIQLFGNQIKLKDGSVALMQVLGTAPASEVVIKAKELVEVTGTNPTSLLPSSIKIENLGFGQVGNLVVNSANLAIRGGAEIGSAQYGSNQGSNVNLNIENEVIVSGTSPLNFFRFSRLGSQTVGTGNGGNVNLSTRKLTLDNGANIGSVVFFGSGSGGDVIINDAESVEVTGEGKFISSSINTSTLGQGNAGRIAINTDRLILKDGGDIDSATLSTGNAGEITINATEFVELTSLETYGSIRSAGLANNIFLNFLGVQQILSGDGGTVIINTPHLNMTGITNVSVANDGTGIAGNLEINADSINLSDTALLSASTNSGEGGNIVGVKSENSDITANAFQGNGGNININTREIFGLEFSNQLTSKSDITASSELGVNGTVKINNIGINSSFGLIELSTELADSSQQISSGCSRDGGSNFIVTGRGGIPQNPSRLINFSNNWFEIRDLSTSRKLPNYVNKVVSNSHKQKSAIVEATGFIRNSSGKIELIASGNKLLRVNQTSDCSGKNT